MSTLSYEESKKKVFYGLALLAIVTLIEVFFSLLGKGHIIKSFHGNTAIAIVVGIILIGLSLYKAYFIIYEFMHMGYEVRGLALSVLLPTALLIWAVIAFFQEGNSWRQRREQIKEKNELPVQKSAPQQGYNSGVGQEDVYLWS